MIGKILRRLQGKPTLLEIIWSELNKPGWAYTDKIISNHIEQWIGTINKPGIKLALLTYPNSEYWNRIVVKINDLKPIAIYAPERVREKIRELRHELSGYGAEERAREAQKRLEEETVTKKAQELFVQ